MKSVTIKIFTLLLIVLMINPRMIHAQVVITNESELADSGAVKKSKTILGYKKEDEETTQKSLEAVDIYIGDLKYKRAKRVRDAGISFLVLGFFAGLIGTTLAFTQNIAYKKVKALDLSASSDLQRKAKELHRNVIIGASLAGAGGAFITMGAIMLGVGMKRMSNVYNLYYYQGIP